MEDKDALLSQWQTCVEMANSVSQRRDSMNNLFVTLNIALLAANSFLWDMKRRLACLPTLSNVIEKFLYNNSSK